MIGEQGINILTFSITCGNTKNCVPFIMATVGIAIDGKKTIHAAESRHLIIAISKAIWRNNEFKNINFLKKIYVVIKIIFQINCPKKLMSHESKT